MKVFASNQAAVVSPSVAACKRLVIVDQRVDHTEILLRDLPADTQVAWLSGLQDPLVEIGILLRAAAPVTELSLVAHGQAGALRVGPDLITATVLAERSGAIVAWQQFLSADATIHLCACEAGAGLPGEALVTQLAALTGARVAAASAPLGATPTGTNWDLDIRSSHFAAALPFSSTARALYPATLQNPVFGESPVNLFTLGEQTLVSLTTLADGSYVVVWQSVGQDGSGSGVFMQRFTAAGQRIGAETQVNSSTLGEQTEASVADLADGGFVVTWTSAGNIFSQRYAADGSAVGAETLVSTAFSSNFDSQVTGLAGGGYVVTWTNSGGQDGSVWGVFGQRYDAAGNAVGTEFVVNTTTASFQYESSLTALADGGFVVVWRDDSGSDGSGAGVFGQRFDAAGNSVGGEFQVNLETSSTQSQPDVSALPTGGFVVTWTSAASGTAGDGSSSGVFARVFDAAGNPITGELPVNLETSSTQDAPVVAVLADGSFVVAWDSATSGTAGDGSGAGVFARRFAADGTALTGEIQVNTETSSTQAIAAITAVGTDGFVIAWQSVTSGTAGDGSGSGIFLQLFGTAADFPVQASPELEGIATTRSFTEAEVNAGPLLIDSNGAAAFSDADSANLAGGQLTVALLTGFGTAEQLGLDARSAEQLGVRNQGTAAGQIGVSGTAVTFGGVAIGTIASNGANGASLIIDFNSNATAEAVEALVENLTYANTSDDPVPSRQYQIQVTDGDGGSSEPVLVTIEIEPTLDGVGPVGVERQVNSFTTSTQSDASVASLSDGGYVVVWDSFGQDGASEGVFAQRYDANGVIVGPELQVNSTVTASQFDPAVTGLNGGGFVVTWTDTSGLNGGSWDVVGQRYDAGGQPVGSEFRINTMISSFQYEPSIAALSDGGFVVVWRDDSGADGSGSGVFGQRYDAAGSAVGVEFQVNTEFSSSQFDPQVVGLAGGGFAVVWTSFTSGSAGDGNGNGVFLQRYDAAGVAVGGELQVNTETSGAQDEPVIGALADGGFVVAWTSASQDSSGDGVYAQRYDAAGNAVGDEFRVNESVGSSQNAPAIVGLGNGGFVIAWGDNSGRDGSGNGVWGQQYDAAGNRVDGEFLINSETASTQAFPALAALGSGNFVAVWESATSGTAGDGSGTGIFQQLFGAPADFATQASPELEGIESEITFQEAAVNSGPQLLDANASVALSDPDSADFDGGSLLVTRLTNPTPLIEQFNAPDELSQDQLGLRNQGTGAGQIGVSGTAITFGGVVIGTLVQDGADGAQLQVDFNSNATAEAVETLVENLTYANSSDDPIPSRQYRVQVSDGDGGSSIPQVVTVNIEADVDGVGPVGVERQVNSFTTSTQSDASVASLSDGGYVVVWDSFGQDGASEGVFAQRYDANGVIVGPELQVNSTVTASQFDPAVTGLNGGGFVVTWTDTSGLNGGSWDVVGQRYDAGGQPVGSEFRINTMISSFQYEPSIAALSDGGFVVVWRDDSGADGSGSGVFGQRYDAAGSAVGVEFQVNTEFSSSQFDPQVVGLAGGGFAVVWTSFTSGSAGDGNGNGVFLQRYDAAGVAVGGELQVNTETSGAQDEPVIGALADGGFVVAWTSASQDSSGDGVYAQRYDAAGNAVGDEFRVNESVGSSQNAPAIVGLGNGGFVIAWGDNSGRDGSGNGVWGQQYDAAGNRVDGEFLINSETASTQAFPALAALGSGNFVAVWESATSGTAGDGSGTGIFQQLFGAPADFATQASPELEGIESEITFQEAAVNSGPQLLDANASVALSDPDSADFDGGSLLVTRLTNPTPLIEQFNAPDELSQDQLGLRNQGTGAGQIGVSGTAITFGGVVIGTLVQDGADGAQLQVDFNSNATAEAVETLVENLTYANSSDDPIPSRQYRVQVSDGDGGSSIPQVVTVNIEADVDGVGPVGVERQVNSFTTSTQSDASVASLSDGGYVVVWDSFGQDGSELGIFGQRYDANGVIVGPEFQVNSTVAFDQFDPAVTGLSGGGFVVTWIDESTLSGDPSSWGILAQRFDATGAPLGGEFLVNTVTFSSQGEPAISSLSDGGFVIVWQDDGGADGSGSGVFGQRYDAAGSAVGVEFQVNTEFSSSQFDPQVVGLAGGGFAVVWTSFTSGSAGDGNGNGVFLQRYDAAGVAVGGELQVNTETSGCTGSARDRCPGGRRLCGGVDVGEPGFERGRCLRAALRRGG